MVIHSLLLMASLAVILLACELFTNSIEWLGHALHLSQGATGSVLAAVGTAMPETMIPIMALIFGATTETGEAIGIGAILGAPFMLSTLAMFVGGVAIITCSLRGKRQLTLELEPGSISTDMKFFLIVFVLAFVAGLIQVKAIKLVIAAALVLSYGIYLRNILKGVSEVETIPRALYFSRMASSSKAGGKPAFLLILGQVMVSLSIIVAGAKLFVSSVEFISSAAGVSPAVLSFLIAPVATELPEKTNSVLWYSRKQDTLALGNITGAMVFQSSMVVALGIILTAWKLEPIELGSVVLALASFSVFYTYLRKKGHLHAYLMLLGGLFYSCYLLYFFFTR